MEQKKELISRDVRKRLSDEMQSQFRAVEDCHARDWISVVGEMQHELVRDFLRHDLKKDASYVEKNTERATHEMRCAITRIDWSREAQGAPFFVAYNRVRRGQLRAGDPVPDLWLYEQDSRVKRSLVHELLPRFDNAMRPLVLAAGSWT